MAQIYTALFIISLLMLTLLLMFFRTHTSLFYVLFFSCVIFINLGYMQIASAKDINSAIYANQVIYVGASFAPYFMLCCVASLCKIHIRKWVTFVLFTYAAFLLFLTSTIGTFDLYYKSVSLDTFNGINFLTKEYGPLHILYPIYLFIVAAGALAILFYSVKNKKEVSYGTCFTLIISCLSVIFTYVIQITTHLHLELLPFAYVVLEVVILALLRRISMYDVNTITTNSMVNSLAYGFILYDSKGKFLGSDDAAKLWFPELLDIKVDTHIKDTNTSLMNQLKKWNSGEEENNTVILKVDDLYIEAQHTVLREKVRGNVHCVYLRDDTKQQQLTKLIQEYNTNLEHDVNEKTAKISEIQNDIIVSMASIVENRDNNTGGHIARTSDVVKVFVKYLVKQKSFPEMDKEVATRIIKAAPLHDFGKIGIPDEVLNKPGKFTPEEYEIMKGHAAKGAVIVERILQNSEDRLFKNIAVNVAHYHHEKWDGNGYPSAISGEEIPFEARIMALADVFDALVSKRVYKEKYSYDRAFSIIEESSGTHFEPKLCKAFLKCRKELENLYDNYSD